MKDSATAVAPPALWGLAAAPFLWMVLFWSFVLRARLSVGHWPTAYNPDPKDLGFIVHHYTLLATLGPSLVGAALVPAIVVILLLRRGSPRRSWVRPAWTAAIAVLGCATFFVWGQYDPGGFLYWFGD